MTTHPRPLARPQSPAEQIGFEVMLKVGWWLSFGRTALRELLAQFCLADPVGDFTSKPHLPKLGSGPFLVSKAAGCCFGFASGWRGWQCCSRRNVFCVFGVLKSGVAAAVSTVALGSTSSGTLTPYDYLAPKHGRSINRRVTNTGPTWAKVTETGPTRRLSGVGETAPRTSRVSNPLLQGNFKKE